tara:strand:- start:10066 stop:10932 length:867 start_codon:yes stop_codon:yes gene_type:complete
MNYIKKIAKLILLTVVFANFTSCIINDNIKDTSILIDPGNDPNFKIIVNTDSQFKDFNRKIVVFDIPIFAFKSVADSKLIHVANILAQYLDNDEDDVIDNTTVHTQLKTGKSFIYLWKTTAERDAFIPPSGYNVYNISADAVNIIWHSNGRTGNFDGSIESVWNFISKNGHEVSYPAIFSSQANSKISDAMNTARGGVFQNPPANYPTGAWYTNTETTCDFSCQVTKYNFWVLSSMLGANENRLTDIQNEWILNTSAKVQSGDVKAWTVFTNTAYKLPSTLPDGTYKH